MKQDKIYDKLLLLASQGQIVPDRNLLKTPEQITAIKKSAALNTAVLDHVAAQIHAGISTADIDKLVYDYTTAHGGIPAPLGYEGFPKSVCTSLNNEICHGIPDENIILQEGDIINVDVQNAKEYREDFKEKFDKVLCDVPCSGLGVIFKKPDIKYKSTDAYKGLPSVQYDILSNCAKYVKKRLKMAFFYLL